MTKRRLTSPAWSSIGSPAWQPAARQYTDSQVPTTIGSTNTDTLVFNHITFGYGFGPKIFADLNHTFKQGTTLLLGPNGSGKSTLLGLASSALTPQSGEVVCNGSSTSHRRSRRHVRRTVGWMPQDTRFYPGMTVFEQVAYAGWLKGMARAGLSTRVDEVLSQVDLETFHERQASQLSGGEIRRVGLAQALVHEPSVLLLDEPTAGLDPVEISNFEAILQRLPQDVSLVLSTHRIADFLPLFEFVVVIADGQVRFDGTAEQFSNGHTDLTAAYVNALGTTSPASVN